MKKEYKLVGKVTIPKKKRKEVKSIIQKILYLGGIREKETIEIDGRQCITAGIPKWNAREVISFNYNMFTNTSYEAGRLYLKAGSIKNPCNHDKEYDFVANLIRVVLESYSTTPCYLCCDNIPCFIVDYARVINEMIGKRLSFPNRNKMWKMYYALHMNGCENIATREILEMARTTEVEESAVEHFLTVALYMLSELEDNDIGFTMCNGDIVSEEKYVGWINQILGTNYSFRKRFNLWENVEWYIENEKCEEMHISMKELFELIPKNLRYAAGGTELADLLWVINGTSSLLPRDLDPDSYAYEVWKCQRAIQEIFIKDLENEEEKILSLLQMPRNRRKSVMDPIMKKLAKFTLFLPARIVLFLYTEFTGDNFWEIWSAIKSGAYHDEKMKKYASKELELYRKIFIEGPIAPVTTSDFLSQDGYFTFWETPSELVGEENYYISDWDRLYWWGKIEDVEITEEIDIWLNMLVKEYEMILKGKEQETENAFVDHIFNTMEYLNSFYGRIYLFKEFYNALLNNSHEVRYQAILDLLDKFGEKNKEIGRVYQKYGNKEWCILSKNLKCNRGRMEIKRIIGVMANKELRKKYFGF